MSMTDPIADMITRMRNAILVGKPEVQFPNSKLKKEIAKVLNKEGYLTSVEEIKEGSFVSLKCVFADEGKKQITHLEKVSKPGRRVYAKKDEIPSVLAGHGLVVLSTSKGVMSGREAKKQGLGGELICKIY